MNLEKLSIKKQVEIRIRLLEARQRSEREWSTLFSNIVQATDKKILDFILQSQLFVRGAIDNAVVQEACQNITQQMTSLSNERSASSVMESLASQFVHATLHHLHAS